MADFELRSNLWRMWIIFAVCMAAYCVLVIRLGYLQIVRGEQYKAWAQGLNVLASPPAVLRGEIFFADGEPLAVNKSFYFVSASPLEITNKEKTASELAKILSLDEGDVLKNLSKSGFYAPIKDKITDTEAAGVKSASLDGIYVQEKKMRYYPQNNLASQIVGFVDGNGHGQYGLEEYYDDQLSAGKDLILNINYHLQSQSEQILADYVQKLNARGGEIIVADPNNGAILTMAQTPNFDPNNYQQIAADGKSFGIFKNSSTQELFEPGSVFKAITMASALNEGKVNPQTSYYDSGVVKVGAYSIYNFAHKSYGQQTMTGVLEKSINTGAVYAENQLGHQAFTDYIKKFGIMQPTGIDLPETYSSNSGFLAGHIIGYDTAAFGQGIWMTSSQLLRAYCALINGGKLVAPSVANVIRENNNSAQAQVIKPETSQTIRKMLQSVVDNGFGKAAKIPGYSIGGKTGTAQISWAALGVDKSGYSDTDTIQSFVGFFPVDNPKFLIIVKLNNPQSNTAEYSVVPVFRDISQYIIYLYQLPPDNQKEIPALSSQPVQNSTSTQPGLSF